MPSFSNSSSPSSSLICNYVLQLSESSVCISTNLPVSIQSCSSSSSSMLDAYCIRKIKAHRCRYFTCIYMVYIIIYNKFSTCIISMYLYLSIYMYV